MKTAPQFSARQASRIARELYGLTQTATPLPSERDQNFRLGNYVLKIANSDEDQGVLKFHNEALRHLGSCIDVPRIVLTQDGHEVATVNGHLVRLLTWMDGECLARVNPHTPELLASLGTVLAAIDAGLANLPTTHLIVNRVLRWDLRYSCIMQRDLRLIPSERVESIKQVLAAWEAIDWGSLRYSVIHGDPNDYNVLVRHGIVASIIDFGDIVYTATVCDLAIAVAYAMLYKPDPLAVAVVVIRAYHQRYPLTPAEIRVVLPLAMTRLARSVCYAAQSARIGCENPFQQLTAAAAWRLLQTPLIHCRLDADCFAQHIDESPPSSESTPGARLCRFKDVV